MVVTKLTSALLVVTPVLLLLGGEATPFSLQVEQTLPSSKLDFALTTENDAFIPPEDADAGDMPTITAGTYFTPPKDARPLRGPATPGGSRYGGCLGLTDTTFTTLGPKDTELVMGQTVSTHPEFVWYLPESETPFTIIFRLLEPNEANTPIPIFEESLDYTAGFFKYQLPQTEKALSPGVNYRWQVIVECNPAYPSRSLVQELSFEVVAPTATLSQALSTATTDAERALAYGQAGIWYNAIAEVAEATTLTAQQTRGGLLSDLANSISPESDPLRQDILAIVAATTPAP